MVCVNLEWLWMVSDRINDFRFFVKFHKSGSAIIFSFLYTMEHVSYASKKLLKNKNTSLTCFVLVTLEGLWIISDRIVDLSIFRQISEVRSCNTFQFFNYHRACSLCIKKDPNQAKDRINMVCVTLERLWMVSDTNTKFRFFVKFHRSGPVIIFSFWTTSEHVSYASKKLLIKQRISSTWCVLLWKNYGWFLIELSIFDFLSSFTGPDLQ